MWRVLVAFSPSFALLCFKEMNNLTLQDRQQKLGTIRVLCVFDITKGRETKSQSWPKQWSTRGAENSIQSLTDSVTHAGGSASFPLHLLIPNWLWWSENEFEFSSTEQGCRLKIKRSPQTIHAIEQRFSAIFFFLMCPRRNRKRLPMCVCSILVFEMMNHNLCKANIPWNFHILNWGHFQLWLLASPVCTRGLSGTKQTQAKHAELIYLLPTFLGNVFALIIYIILCQ